MTGDSYILPPPERVDVDVLASMMAFASRGYRLLGPCPERRDLARHVGPGPLASLLAGPNLLLCRWDAEGYLFIDYGPPGAVDPP